MTSDRIKVRFQLDPKQNAGLETESVWAAKVGTGRFRIENSPFFAFGVSAEDIVEAKETGEIAEFRRVLSRGGHSTYRIFLQRGQTVKDLDFQRYWAPIAELGATFENANDHFVAVDIPADRDVVAIYQLFEKGEQDGLWIFEEGHYQQPTSKTADNA